MSDQRTINTYDPVAGEPVDVPAHPYSSAFTLAEWLDLDPDDRAVFADDAAPPAYELPVILETDFRADPVEGEQGTYTAIVELNESCPRCGYDRGVRRQHTLAGVGTTVCRACDYEIDPP